MNTSLIEHRLIYAILVACMVFASQALASDEDKTDVILLKNGSTIRGRITEKVPGDKVVIERADGQVFEVPVEKIFALTDEDHLEQRRKELELFKPKSQFRGWENVTTAGFYRGEGSTFFAVSSVSGAWLGDNLFLGLGIGWDNYPDGNMVPLFAEARIYRKWRSLRPFAFVDAGYSFGWIEDMGGAAYGGLQLTLGVGTKLFAGSKGALPVIQFGFRLQGSKENIGNGAKRSVIYEFITVMAGVAF